jgi:hypothetical protein
MKDLPFGFYPIFKIYSYCSTVGGVADCGAKGAVVLSISCKFSLELSEKASELYYPSFCKFYIGII